MNNPQFLRGCQNRCQGNSDTEPNLPASESHDFSFLCILPVSLLPAVCLFGSRENKVAGRRTQPMPLRNAPEYFSALNMCPEPKH
jgi:hypothetical protein